VTDDRPRIEHGAWTRRGEFGRVLEALLAAASPAPLQNATPEMTQAVDAERNRLIRFYHAALAGLRGDRVRAMERLRQVLSEAPGNPYYAWFGAR
jgi:spermidine synthase